MRCTIDNTRLKQFNVEVTHDQNCTCNKETGSYTNVYHDFTYTAKEGYSIVSGYPKIMSSGSYRYNVTGDDKQKTISVLIDKETRIYCKCEEVSSDYVQFDADLINCTMELNPPNNLLEGDEVTITIRANEGYKFTKPPTYVDVVTGSFDLIDSYTAETTLYSIMSMNVKIKAEAVQDTPELNHYFVNLYKVTDNELLDLSKTYFISGDRLSDKASFIKQLIEIPFNVDNTVVDNIILGNGVTNVKSNYVANPVITINVGNIIVGEKYHNAYDYINTTCTIHLPYTTPIELPVEHVVNQTVSVFYKVDLYSGKGTVNIKSSSVGDRVIKSESRNFASVIPFVQDSSNLNGLNTIEQLIDNDINQAYIEIKRFRPYDDNNSPFGRPVKEYVKIGDCKGFAQFDNVRLDTRANAEEDDEIKQLLKAGVFIQDVL